MQRLNTPLFRPYDYDIKKLMNLTNIQYKSSEVPKKLIYNITSIEYITDNEEFEYEYPKQRKHRQNKFPHSKYFKKDNFYLNMIDKETEKPRYVLLHLN